DLKPSNILVTAEGQVKLLDFGIAKLLGDAQSPGAATELTRQAGRAYTALYAAPEQLQGDDVSTATDVYALGVLLYQLLGGRHPTMHSSTTTPLDQMRAVIEFEPKRLSDTVAQSIRADAARLARELRGDLDNIVAKALKKAPGQRYANAAQFADDLRRYLDHEPVSARADGAAYRVGKFLRRHRLGVAAGAVVTLALAGGLGVAVWQAREAQRQRVQAEGLIEFMLGDLRKKLQPVGRLDVLDAVGEKALAYYAAQEAAGLDASALGRRARALHLIGQIAEQRGNLEEASTVFNQAAESTATLMQRYPKDGQRVFDHAQSVFWVGYVAWRRGQTTQAEASFRSYIRLAEQLTQMDASNMDWRIEKISADANLGVLLLESGRPAEALARFDQARRDWADMARAKPADLYFELANAWGWVARAHEALGQFRQAIEAQQAKSEALKKVPNGERNHRVERLLSLVGDDMGRLHLALGDPASAKSAAAQALARSEALVAQDPSNRDWLSLASFGRLNLAEILLALGETNGATAHVKRAAADIAKLLSTDSTRIDWQINLQGRLIEISAQLPAGAPTVEQVQAYLAAVQRAEAGAKATDAERNRIAAIAQTLAGDLAAANGQAAQAQAHWRAAIQRLDTNAAAADPGTLTLLAQAKLRMGLVEEAQGLAKRIESSPYRHPQFADLQRRLAAAKGTVPVN
ncbi:MAG: protein kinase domain-containing protein, partial [Pseudomonadota bacterium]